MKNQITSKILKFAFAFMFILSASSCSEDNDAMDAAALAKDQINSEISAKGGKPTTAVVVASFAVPDEVCASEATAFCFTAAIGTNLQVQQWIAGEWVQVYQIAQSTSENTCFNLTFATEGTYQLRYKIGAGGFTQVSVNVVDCSEGCDESFSYVANGGGSYTFTYTPAESVTNANLVFTFAQGTYVSGLADFSPAGVTMQKTMDLVACTTYNWTVILQSNCKGGGQNDANVWTDFKVGSESKKGQLSNIVIACPN
ncbi:MAG TPA: hypothetical protein VIN72_11020 [Lutibacter sp.]